jgi:hypothetical protein
VIRVWVGEQEVELARTQLGRQRRLLLGDLRRKLGVARREMVELDQVASALLQLVPGLDQLAILGSFAGERAGTARIVPDAGLR